MEFLIANINFLEPVTITPYKVHDKSEFGFLVEHNGRKYDTASNDVFYFYGEVKRYVDETLLEKMGFNHELVNKYDSTELKVYLLESPDDVRHWDCIMLPTYVHFRTSKNLDIREYADCMGTSARFGITRVAREVETRCNYWQKTTEAVKRSCKELELSCCELINPDNIKNHCILCAKSISGEVGANPDMFICDEGCQCLICAYGRCCKECDENIVVPTRRRMSIYVKERRDEFNAEKRHEIYEKIKQAWSPSVV